MCIIAISVKYSPNESQSSGLRELVLTKRHEWKSLGFRGPSYSNLNLFYLCFRSLKYNIEISVSEQLYLLVLYFR